MKPRIHLIGGPGSGKSYTAKMLADRLDVPAHDLDDLFWDRSASGYGVRTEPIVRDRRLAALVDGDGWIIEGVYYGWVTPSFVVSDIIIALTPSLVVRQWRVMKRFVFRKTGRALSPTDESLADLWRLMRWSHTYDSQHLAPARRAVTALGRTWVECRTLDDVNARVANLNEPPTGGARTRAPEVRR